MKGSRYRWKNVVLFMMIVVVCAVVVLVVEQHRSIGNTNGNETVNGKEYIRDAISNAIPSDGKMTTEIKLSEIFVTELVNQMDMVGDYIPEGKYRCRMSDGDHVQYELFREGVKIDERQFDAADMSEFVLELKEKDVLVVDGLGQIHMETTEPVDFTKKVILSTDSIFYEFGEGEYEAGIDFNVGTAFVWLDLITMNSETLPAEIEVYLDSLDQPICFTLYPNDKYMFGHRFDGLQMEPGDRMIIKSGHVSMRVDK